MWYEVAYKWKIGEFINNSMIQPNHTCTRQYANFFYYERNKEYNGNEYVDLQ